MAYTILNPAEGFVFLKNRKIEDVSNIFVKKFHGIDATGWMVRSCGRLIMFNKQSEAIEMGRTLGMGELFRLVKGDSTGRCMERIGVFKKACCHEAMDAFLGDRLITKEIEFISKVDPLDDNDFVSLIVLLARKMMLDSAATDAEYEKHYMKVVNSIDWTQATQKQMTAAINSLNTFLPPSTAKVMKRFQVTLGDSNEKTFKATKKSVKKKFKMDISTSLNLADEKAIKAISNYGIAYVPTSFKKQSSYLSGVVAKEVEYGLRKGFSSGEISDNVYTKIGEKNPARRNTWIKLAAHAAVARARSRSLVLSYMEAGIEKAIVSAVRDEQTTEICNFLDGKVVDIKIINKQWTDLEEEENPDFEATFPWMKQSSSGGVTRLSIRDQEVASGPSGGITFNKGYGMDDMMALGVGMPDYHPLCRSTTIAVFE